MKRWLVVPLTVMGFLVAPEQPRADAGSGAAVGAVTGAMVGSLAGPMKNRVENSLIGAVAGGLLGYAAGNEHERQGRTVVYRSLEYAPSYQTTTWVNPENRVSYIVTPRPVRYRAGQACREVEIQATIDARRETLSGLSCRDGAGQWRLMDRVNLDAPTVVSRTVVASPPPSYVVVEPAPTVVVQRRVYYPDYYYAPYYGRPHHYDRAWRDRHWRRY
ncbi:MAG: glycine zipper 2TM domain-containing protein [Magnetococcales bacterium]|nr:glycine zipper 2TM domain-containing protein [Magnetococcales bacterium]